MRTVLFLAAFFLGFSGCKDCDCEDVVRYANPDLIDVSKPPEPKKSLNNIMVSIDGQNKFFIGTRVVPEEDFDSLLKQEIQVYRARNEGEVMVIINADTAANYGNVFRIMRLAKKDSAKVVARVE